VIDGLQTIVTPTIENATRLDQVSVADVVTDALLQDGSGIEFGRVTMAATRSARVLVVTVRSAPVPCGAMR
jgi:hypothetical protein